MSDARDPSEGDSPPAPASGGADTASKTDRAAILARRQHFIALALTGLASTAACDRKGSPQPCLDMPPPSAGEGGEPPAEAGGPPPQPCLKMADPDDEAGETGPPPQPCLKMADPGDEAGETGEPPPQPCLKVAPPDDEGEPTIEPQPCLKVAPPDDPAPRPCLRKVQPKPSACLNIAKPEDPEPLTEEL